MREEPTAKDLLEAVMDGVLEPAKDPAIRKMHRLLEVIFGLALFFLALPFAFITGYGLVQDLAGADYRHVLTEIIFACGCTAAACLGVKLIFNLKGSRGGLISPSALLLIGLSLPVFLVHAYFTWELRLSPKETLALIVCIVGCIVIAIRRWRGA